MNSIVNKDVLAKEKTKQEIIARETIIARLMTLLPLFIYLFAVSLCSQKDKSGSEMLSSFLFICGKGNRKKEKTRS